MSGTASAVLMRGDETRLLRGPVDDGSAHELGSVSKVVTAAAVLRQVRQEGWSIDDRALLARDRKGRPTCSVRQILQHRSGLPRLHDAMRGADPENPYAVTTVERIEATFDRRAGRLPARMMRGHFAYSNFAYAALGHRVARMCGTSWPAVVERTLVDFGASQVWVDDAPPHVPRAPAHDERGRPVPWWDLGAYSPAGGLRATREGLVSLCRGMLRGLEREDTPLHAALCSMVDERWTGEGGEVGLGWQFVRDRADGDPIVWHNGATGGSWSLIALRPARRSALAATGSGPPSDDVQRRLVQELQQL